MTKILTWRDEWTLGINTLDDDHRELVDLLLDIARRFGEAMKHPEGSGEDGGADEGVDEGLYAALDGFGAAARRHFQREEEFIRTIDYPGLADHRSEHLMLTAEFTDLVRGMRERGVTRLGLQDLETLKQWVLAHIIGVDRKFADYYFQICDREPGRRRA